MALPVRYCLGFKVLICRTQREHTDPTVTSFPCHFNGKAFCPLLGATPIPRRLGVVVYFIKNMNRSFSNILVTGGAGFIGSNFIQYLFNQPDFKGNIINLDKLTYAGNLESLKDIAQQFEGNRYFFEQIDITNSVALETCFEKYQIACVVHFAAESHVDRSITGPAEFINTNIVGTFNLLEIAKKNWFEKKTGKNEPCLFHHVSTDEVYGSLGESGLFLETTPYDPRSPYSASKAASDHIVSAYYHTYDFPITISNCSNNYGAYQFPEKLIPVMILNILEEKPLPVYGNGNNIRDWLYVDDHCSGIWGVVSKGKIGSTYNIGGDNEWTNIKLVHKLCEILADRKNKDKDYYKKLITYVKDRPGHDLRYAINCEKIKQELGWKQSVTFDAGLEKTVNWYLNNLEWVEHIQSGEYQKWMIKNYSQR
jgi:dTDP-glucose 4,6-dehydratase